MKYITNMTQAQFEMTIEAALGDIDYELILLAVADYYFRRSKDLRAQGLENAYEREFKKGEKILDHVCSFRKLNEEVLNELHC